MERDYSRTFSLRRSLSRSMAYTHCLRFNGTNYSHHIEREAPRLNRAKSFWCVYRSAQSWLLLVGEMPPLFIHFIHHFIWGVSMRVELKCHHLIDDVSFTSQSLERCEMWRMLWLQWAKIAFHTHHHSPLQMLDKMLEQQSQAAMMSLMSWNHRARFQCSNEKWFHLTKHTRFSKLFFCFLRRRLDESDWRAFFKVLTTIPQVNYGGSPKPLTNLSVEIVKQFTTSRLCYKFYGLCEAKSLILRASNRFFTPDWIIHFIERRAIRHLTSHHVHTPHNNETLLHLSSSETPFRARE